MDWSYLNTPYSNHIVTALQDEEGLYELVFRVANSLTPVLEATILATELLGEVRVLEAALRAHTWQ